MENIQKTTEAARYQMRRASAMELPDRPSAAGMSATQIKRALWAPMLGVEHSLLSEQDRIVDETNAALSSLDARLGDVGVTEEYFGEGISVTEMLATLYQSLTEAVGVLKSEALASVGDPTLELATDRQDLRGAVNELSAQQKSLTELMIVAHRILGCFDATGAFGLVGDLRTLGDLGQTVVGALRLLDERIAAVDHRAVEALRGRLTEIEDWIERQYEFMELAAEDGHIKIPRSARRYAQILELGGAYSTFQVWQFYENHVVNYPIQLLSDTGRELWSLSEEVERELLKLNGFGIGGNSIVFEDGRVYYRQTTKVVESAEALGEGEEEIDWIYDYYKQVRLKEAIVTDITDLFSHDGIIDLDGSEGIVVVPKHSEEDVKGRISPDAEYPEDGYYYGALTVRVGVEAC